jgi:signal transduction histidine kinase
MYPLNLPRKNMPAPKDVVARAFPGISQLEIDELVLRSQVKSYPEKTVLCREGKLETKFYILLDGIVDVTKTINHTEVRQLKVLEAGDFFGEMAIMHNAPRGATVTASGPVTVLEIDKENFDRVIQRSSTISVAMVREISRRLRENDETAAEDLKLRASELAEAYQKLAEQDLARREFLSNVAHELRTPLMAASGFLLLLQKGLIPEDKLPATIDTVARNIQQITTLVNDILFLQEMDLILPKFQAVEMVAIANEVAEKYQDKAAANLLTIQVDAEKNLPDVSGDPKSLERALTALVDNAIKFSPHGGQVGIKLREEANQVVIEVKDQGIGIEPDLIPRIFDRFYHIEKNDENLFGGIGLGLAITNQVIKQHNGRISVESEPGRGSTFSVWLKAIKMVF